MRRKGGLPAFFASQNKMDRKERERILVFSSREICYCSGNFFANQIAAAFEEMGFCVDICEMSKGDDLDEKLASYIGVKYRLILDFNSMLPQLVMDDDTSYLDMLDGPFYDYILDHPLFHYNSLNRETGNLHVIVLDEAHEAYIRTYYPKVKSVYTLPLGATKALYQGEKEQECRVAFLGTYDTPEQVYKLIEAAPEPLCGTMKELLERRLSDPLLPMEQAFEEYLRQDDMSFHDTPLGAKEFALYMNAMYAVDVYVRDYFRKAALDELLAHRIPVTVFGNGWEKYSHTDESCLRREKALPFALSFERMAKEHILLNVSPIFNRGMHDRIPAGMANRAVVLTDGNPYLAEHFQDGKQLCMYTLSKIHTLSDRAGELLESRSVREEIAACAYEEFERHHTWNCRARQILRHSDGPC